jgi:hypothetical protein
MIEALVGFAQRNLPQIAGWLQRFRQALFQ